MTDYTLTKAVNKDTGQMPDKLTVVLPPKFAWVLIKQLLMQLEIGKEQISLDIYGKVETPK